jgi:AAA ATPase domain
MAGTTLGQAISALEEYLFVGRERELAAFRDWLEKVSPAEILAVSGPGGVGKTALLAAFHRYARAQGRHVLCVDGQHLRPSATALLAAFGGRSTDAVVRRLQDSQAVVLFDSFDQVARVWPFLRDRLFSRVDGNVRIVTASRQPMTSLLDRDDVWHKVVRLVPLDGLSPHESSVYLERRGLADQPALVEQILATTRGHPLAMSLAADLAERLHVASLESVPEWHLVVRGLVERLRETEDANIRELLECASIVYVFDEATLLAIAGRWIDPAAFARLCSLSILRPTAYGLTLHDEVRCLVAEDLRWRNAERFNNLRTRAVACSRAQCRAPDPVARARALTNRFYLSDASALRTMLFGDGTAPVVMVQPVPPSQHAEIRKTWGDNVVAATRLRVVCDTRQQIHGLAGVVRLPRDVPVVNDQAATLERLVGRCRACGHDDRPAGFDLSQLFWHVHLIRDGEDAAARSTLGALLRESVSVFAEGGVHLTRATTPQHQAALEALGFESVPGVDGLPGGSADLEAAYILDLRQSGVDLWVESVTAGRPQQAVTRQDIENELRGVLAHWQNDIWLNRSSVVTYLGVGGATARPDAAQTRELVRAALTRFIDGGNGDDRLAGKAVELASLPPRVSYVAAMERLSVSRATFYRLLKRGIHGLAQLLVVPETT